MRPLPSNEGSAQETARPAHPERFPEIVGRTGRFRNGPATSRLECCCPRTQGRSCDVGHRRGKALPTGRALAMGSGRPANRFCNDRARSPTALPADPGIWGGVHRCRLLSAAPVPEPARDALLRELLHPSEMGLNVCRTCIGASDYSTELYGFDEGEPDPELKRFSIEHDREYLLPTLRAARAVNPELILFSSPWSPPGWMKANGSLLGGSMRKKHFASYAQYFVKFLAGYAAEGVPIHAVTTQNEVDTDQDGRMPA